MPTELIPCGMPVTLTQNVVYALPVCKATIFVDTGSPTLQQSNTLAFTNNVAVTLTGGTATIAGGFIRSTAGAAAITLSRD